MKPGQSPSPWTYETIFNLCLLHGACLTAHLFPGWGMWAASHIEPIEDET